MRFSKQIVRLFDAAETEPVDPAKTALNPHAERNL